jgi:hypothetical protein
MEIIIMVKDEVKAIADYWAEVGLLKVLDSNGYSHSGKPVGFFNGFFILSTIEGGRVWIAVDSIVSIRELGIVVHPTMEEAM